MKATFAKTALALAALIATSTAANAQVNSRFVQTIDNQATTQTAPNQARVTPSVTASPTNGQWVDDADVAPALPAPRFQIAPPIIEPETCQFIPRLQFDGRMIPHVGMQVVHTDHGGVAEKLGLEAGDIIVRIDGRRIDGVNDYKTALHNAAYHNHGHLDLLVRNVRWRPGSTYHQKYVHLHADLPRVCPVVPAIAAR